MWMRGYTNPSTTVPDSNGGGANDQFGTTMSPVDSVNGRRLRPLIPKPSTSTTPSLPTFFNHGNCDTASLFTLNHLMASPRHHLMGGGEQGRRDQFNGHQSVVVSSRWNPTPDQLRALEELYRRGTRTPSADQIQHITAQLRRYGKIEGKNVFYWFQNHKARERQKRRRQQLENTTCSQDHQEQPAGDGSNHNDNKGSKTGFETEQTKLWAAPTNCSTLADQESVYKKPEKAAAECVSEDEWVQFQDHQNSLQIASTTMLQDSHGGIGDDHRRRRTSLNLIAKNSMWDKTQLPLPKPTIMHQTSLENYQGDEYEDHHKVGALTLQLFPLRSNGAMDLIKDDQDDDDDDDDEKGTHLTSCQFIEFLPLKNSTAY